MCPSAKPTDAPQSERPTIPVPPDRVRVKYDSLLPPVLADIADALDVLTGRRPRAGKAA